MLVIAATCFKELDHVFQMKVDMENDNGMD